MAASSSEVKGSRPAPSSSAATSGTMTTKPVQARSCCGEVAYTVGKNNAGVYLNKFGGTAVAQGRKSGGGCCSIQ
eukprot:CAMPEP_0172532158 /NCGR_PEP_ID=MMETSP1067-20121228/5313_1 /TAXON_ID=265564 ORGANISM="Thalassiosira punctigera, Strain Tpunct2005C2" /NCGR_SAMPLE_ID=MMETSP1067 /ASSEMBLY_ACC=CAM_ASM_000444 /LENGTH=74 /DNA_ID=CAMNT_0013316635 /DNA_START=26 /DNA_END=250 /DNA_ORIENTATION=-